MTSADQALAQLASARRRLLAELEGLDDARFVRRPPGSWSASDVLEHLARVEGNVLRGARHATEKGSKVRPGLLDPLRRLTIRTGLVQWVRVRTVRGADPAEDPGAVPLPREQALGRLDHVRQETVAWLEATRARDLSRVYLRHPFFGAYTVRDMFGWVAWHEERHRGQVLRIRRALGAS